MRSLPCIASISRHGNEESDFCLIDDVYCTAYQRKLCATPFTPHRLCLYAEALHRSVPEYPLFVYFFDPDGMLLAQLPLHSLRLCALRAQYPAILKAVASTNAPMLAFSISGTRTDKHVAALAEQLMLFCQTNRLALMEIAVCKEPVFYPFLETHIQK